MGPYSGVEPDHPTSRAVPGFSRSPGTSVEDRPGR